MFAWGYSPSFAANAPETDASQPNIVFVLTDDHRWDSYGTGGNPLVETPHLDDIAESGTRFDNAFVTLATCSPSRTACLTRRYGSVNGVTAYGNAQLNDGEATFAHALRKGNAAFDKPFASGWPRASREVESERQLANIHGTFYEIPLVTNGAPPAWNLVRPVSSHSKQITDFCSWNGLLVLSGIRPNAKNDGHIFRDETHNTGLWFGGIDDLWKFGKPIGNGGPWSNTNVKSGVPSDPYLMRGYDRKTVLMSHDDSDVATITLQIDLDGKGLWVNYNSFQVSGAAPVRHEFPDGFSACWVRAICNTDTSATVQFEYR